LFVRRNWLRGVTAHVSGLLDVRPGGAVARAGRPGCGWCALTEIPLFDGRTASSRYFDSAVKRLLRRHLCRGTLTAAVRLPTTLSRGGYKARSSATVRSATSSIPTDRRSRSGLSKVAEAGGPRDHRERVVHRGLALGAAEGEREHSCSVFMPSSNSAFVAELANRIDDSRGDNGP
jgi:hypothetical protein